MSTVILLLALLIIIIITAFSVQNAAHVTVALFYWKFEASLAIVILLSVLSGAFIAGLIYYLLRFSRLIKRKTHRSRE